MPRYVRFQSAAPNRRGAFPGVFALANGLRASGLISGADRRWLDAADERANARYADPSTVTPDCYDPTSNPGARSWFRAEASEMLAMASGYLDLLDRAGIPWTELRTTSPGRITHADDVQVVAVPLSYPDDWPFASEGRHSRPS